VAGLAASGGAALFVAVVGQRPDSHDALAIFMGGGGGGIAKNSGSLLMGNKKDRL
jgi:hypothetical protein